jgi:hypothetical protein
MSPKAVVVARSRPGYCGATGYPEEYQIVLTAITCLGLCSCLYLSLNTTDFLITW